jgi:hypothetical protein
VGNLDNFSGLLASLAQHTGVSQRQEGPERLAKTKAMQDSVVKIAFAINWRSDVASVQVHLNCLPKHLHPQVLDLDLMSSSAANTPVQFENVPSLRLLQELRLSFVQWALDIGPSMLRDAKTVDSVDYPCFVCGWVVDYRNIYLAFLVPPALVFVATTHVNPLNWPTNSNLFGADRL